ncbi:hypothetical protein BDR26DRAFT_583744 [Obelidium mucronatum]|nr:hypothetical protein BDR26DRAFT_583744 [Obelidium mucronatum]
MEEPTLAEQAAATSAQTLSSIKGSKVELISKSKESLGNLISSEKGSTSKLSNKGGETPRNNDDQKEIVTNSSAPTSARASRIGSKDNLAGSRLLASKEVNKSGDKLTSTAPHSQSNLVKSATSKAASKSNIRNAESVSALKKPSSIMGSTRKLENQEAAPSKKESAAGSRAGSKTLSRSGSSSDLKSRLASKTGSRVASKHQLQQEESQHSFHGSSTNLSKAQSSQSIGRWIYSFLHSDS